MTKPPDPGGGGRDSSPKTTTPADGRGSIPRIMIALAEILCDEKNHRNILEVKIVRKNSSVNMVIKPLNEEEISEFF